MHGACGVIETACKINFSNNFEKWKAHANRFAIQKMETACGINDTTCKYDTACTTEKKIRAALTAFKENIYKKGAISQKIGD
jgi:hypothetical protein